MQDLGEVHVEPDSVGGLEEVPLARPGDRVREPADSETELEDVVQARAPRLQVGAASEETASSGTPLATCSEACADSPRWSSA
jgi:hypothetical protein